MNVQVGYPDELDLCSHPYIDKTSKITPATSYYRKLLQIKAGMPLFGTTHYVCKAMTD